MTCLAMSKKNFFLQTLGHECLATIVENVLSKDSTTYAEIHVKLMAIAQSREISVHGPESFNVRIGQTPQAGGKPPARDPSKECSFCKTNEDYFKGHTMRKEKKAGKGRNSANVPVMTAACWITTANHYSWFIDQCFIDVEYPDIS
ncbi:hypothetical protein Q9L58_010632 [Maublancomyces gigas]|uniref:Uncharacterized protein n=1 Tax=Discina gigas TaxID=1032678 RepID=A0ABR3G464_9PEZI